MLRKLGSLLFATLGIVLPIFAQPSSPDSSTDDYDLAAQKTTHAAYEAWVAETDAKRKGNDAAALFDDAIQSGDKKVVAELLRGGPHRERWLPLPKETTRISARLLLSLPGVIPSDNSSQYDHASSPIFRRMTSSRFEAWAQTEGWLFDGKGRLLSHVHVPRRDGTGRAWFGAFLPSGRWITTDLWGDDRQLNCFTPDGKWLWELRGQKMIFTAHSDDVEKPPGVTEGGDDEVPIRWARCDKTGTGWIACLGFGDPAYVWVSPTGECRPVPQNNPWMLTYPRAMQAKGTYLELQTPSDDGKETLVQNSAGHGNWIDFPTYSNASWPAYDVIPDGDAYFGFWPNSHAAWIESDEATSDLDGKVAAQDKKIWLLASNGAYQAEIDAAWLGDAADEKSLLFCDEQHRVLTVAPSQTHARQFQDGSTLLQPLAVYDDLRLGFFFNSKTNNIVLAGW